MKSGKLYLIPSFLAETEKHDVFPSGNFSIINRLDEFIVEELKTARRFLRKIGYTKDFDEVIFHLLNEHTDIIGIEQYLKSAQTGKDIGLLSEAGTPCVADPGAEIVKIAQRRNIKVVPLVGPNSILLALMASGFNGQRFVFNGYLPIDKNLRRKAIVNLEKQSKRFSQTQIFIETPYRNIKLFEDVLLSCTDNTMLCVALNISSKDESILTKSVSEWKSIKVDFHKKPAVFLILA